MLNEFSQKCGVPHLVIFFQRIVKMMPHIFFRGECVCVPYVQPNHAKAQLWFTVGYSF